MPVATTTWWPSTRSSIPKMRSMSSIPCSAASAISVRESGQSWPCTSPPRHRSAAAEMTPSMAPPIPMARWSLVPRIAAVIEAVMSPSSISLMRAPASRISATRSSWRGRSSTIAVMSPTCRPNASAIAARFSPTGRRRSIRPLATGPTAIFFMYMRGSGVSPPGSDAARIESAPWRPPATAAPFPIGSHARSRAGPPPPSSRPSASGWPGSSRPITSRPEIGTPASALTIASDAARSAASASPRPRYRPAASTQRSVTAVSSVQRHGSASAGSTGTAVTASAWACTRSGYRGLACGGALEDQIHHRDQRLIRVARLDDRPSHLLGPSDEVVLDAADLAEAAQVAVHRPDSSARHVAEEEVALVGLLVGDREHRLDDHRPRMLIGGDQAGHEMDALDDRREALEDRPLHDRVRADGHLAGLLEEAVERPVLRVGVGHRHLEALGGLERREVQLGHELGGE